MAISTFQSIEGPYLRDVLDQPRSLQATIGRLRISRDLEKIAARVRDRGFARIVLTGMGASFHALWPLYLRLAAQGHNVYKAETSELVYYMRQLLARDTLVVAVSQSGLSGEITRLLDLNRGLSTLIGITNTAGSPLATLSNVALLTSAGPEFSVSCKTYITALVELYVLGALFSGEEASAAINHAGQLVPAVENYLAGRKERIFELISELEGVRQIFVLGRGNSLASVGDGALVLKESVRFPAEGMSSAAFRHGPFETVEPSTLALVFAGAERTRDLQENLVRDIREAGGRTAWIGDGGSSSAWSIPEASDDLRPVLEILPIQMASFALAARSGIEAGRFTRVGKITIEE